MPDYVLKIAHVLPTYYFVENNELIKSMETLDFNGIKPLLINGGIVIGFSVVFICLLYTSEQEGSSIIVDENNSQDDKLHISIGGMDEWCHWFRVYSLFTDGDLSLIHIFM